MREQCLQGVPRFFKLRLSEVRVPVLRDLLKPQLYLHKLFDDVLKLYFLLEGQDMPIGE